MALKRRDWIFLAVVAAVFLTFYLISGETKTSRIPQDETHQRFYDVRGEMKRINIDAMCAECHDGVQIAFPPDHPIKPGEGPMRCTFCHKFVGQ